METKMLKIKVAIHIQKPVHDVFEAIVDPELMSKYFILKGSARLEEGAIIRWEFPELEYQFMIRVSKIKDDKNISFYWADIKGPLTLVEIKLTEENGTTFVRISEKERKNSPSGIKWLKQNTEGWANFLACLKAYLEYGVNLRKGAFDSSQMPDA
jgi:uncharacterized protein YndB with AHSA1/START domain